MIKYSARKFAPRVAKSAAVLVLMAGVFGGSQALAGIASTKHNLGSTGTGTNKFGGTEELCVFCHTPHGADASASVPLWNRALPNATTYTTYNSLGTSSLDGLTAPVGSVSIACLSCHDGAQAMNVMINQPGSGGYLSTGAALTGIWTGFDKPQGIANLEKDLTNDHPIGIQYAGGKKTGLPSTGLAVISEYNDQDFVPSYGATINNKTVWWVDVPTYTVNGVGGTGTASTRQKTDMQLYTRDVATSVGAGGTSTTGGTAMGGNQPFVECASCHDPHVSGTKTFLRIDNTGSAVCLACHIK